VSDDYANDSHEDALESQHEEIMCEWAWSLLIIECRLYGRRLWTTNKNLKLTARCVFFAEGDNRSV
jgi:hypothetical protein